MLHAIASQIGQTERDNQAISPAVLSYLAAVGIEPQNGVCPPWQAALLAWGAQQSKLAMPENAALPISWLTWGSALIRPQAGAVVILTSAGRPEFQCGVAARVAGSKIYVIGAFDRVVQTRAFPIEQVIAARAPMGGLAMVDLPPEQPAMRTIEAQPVNVVVQMPQQMALAAPDLPQPVQPQPPVQEQAAPQQPEITQAHLEGLLKLMRAEFQDMHQRIDAVAENALGAVHIKEEAT